ncbi:MAG: UvrD-helicase domain-containing protein [Verrucomicrobia bacterium]|nr:UvrD-helicase domain-containing protein [Verrucomicrobiota bacterium]
MRVNIPHRLIMASAGSGKTFQLVSRYISLLAVGAEPGKILAATFARKAAGEILDKIMLRLCEASLHADKARETAQEIGQPKLTSADFARLLASMIRSLPRLRISTLDSFIIGIIQSFPLELGIEPDLNLMDGDGPEARTVRSAIFQWLFTSRELSDADRQAFLESFKLATFGEESVACQSTLDKFIRSYIRLFDVLDQPRQWGAWDQVGVDPDLWYHQATRTSAVSAMAAVRRWLTESSLGKSVTGAWEKMLDAFEPSLDGETMVAPPTGVLFPRVLEAILAPGAEGGTVITVSRKEISLPAEVVDALRSLLGSVFARELEACRKRALGMYQLLALYDSVHHQRAVERGILTFEDASRLLARRRLATGDDGAHRDEDLLWIDYRMDGRIDHWLLDEFQDTSTIQWEIMKGMADEVLQDTGENRSFFCVGDVKQSIYRWRGGNPRLMTHLRDSYQGRLGSGEVLSTSYRSSPQVIDFVNRIFGHLDAVTLNEPQLEAKRRWDALWKDHQCAPGNRPLPGYVALLEPHTDDRLGKQSPEDVYQLVVDVLAMIQPLQRGYTVGILVSRNSTANALAQVIRTTFPEWPVSQLGGADHLNNMAVPLILSLLKAVLHPGDSLALRHGQLSPLASHLPQLGEDATTWRAEERERLHREDLAGWIKCWADRLLDAIPPSRFLAYRLQRLGECAAHFETTGANLDQFPNLVAGAGFSEEGSAQAIQIMTVHKAKGLEFDLVILPELMGGLGRKDQMLIREQEETGRPEWILKNPASAWHGADETIVQAVHDNERDDFFDLLCKLYVAVTRAKRALIGITTFPGESSGALSGGAILKEALGGNRNDRVSEQLPLSDGNSALLVYESSAAERIWYEKKPLAEKDRTPPPAPLGERRPNRNTEAVRRTPSAEAEAPRDAAFLFDAAVLDSLEIGHAVHHLLEQVTWVDDVDPDALFAAWLAADRPGDRVAAQVRQHWETSLAVQALAAPARTGYASVEVWNEYTFDCLLAGEWVTGAFDRIVVYRDDAGKPVAADIFDYKTNQIDEPDARNKLKKKYRPQLALYQTVLAAILGIDVAAVSAALILTRTGEVVPIDGRPLDMP